MRKPSAFTLVELLFVFGIVGVVMAVLHPAVARARGAANSVTCASNLH